MKKNVKILIAVAGALLCGCSKLPEQPEIPEGANPMEIICEPMQGEQAKSSFTSEALTKVSNVCIFIYKDGALVDSRYFNSSSGISVSFPSQSDSYNVYMLANMGEVTAPQSEQDVKDITYTFMDYGLFNSKGFPMANSFMGYTPGSSTTFRLKRLIGMYSISMDNSSDVVDYHIKSLQMRNCAREIFPFKSVPATVFQQYGDLLSDADLEALNRGESVNIYFLENLQGELLPGNTDPKQKIPDNLPQSHLATRCTYLQMCADVTTPTAHYDNIYYRLYLGQNMTTDFSIVRSTLYNLSLNFAKNMIADEGWRIEPEDPAIIGNITLSKTTAGVIKGVDDVIFVTTQSANGSPVQFDVSLASNAASQGLSFTTYDSSYHGKPAKAIKFTATKSIEGLCPWDVQPSEYSTKVAVTFTSRDTYNGEPTITKTAYVDVYRRAFPILLKARQNGSSWDLYAYSSNPMKLGMRFDYSTCNGQDLTKVKSGWSRFQRYGINFDILEDDPVWDLEDYTLDRNGRKIGSLGSIDQYPNGMRLDVNLTPISDSNFETSYGNEAFLEYPKFSNSQSVYMGSGTKAHFGPGPNLAPGKYTPYEENYGAFYFSANGKLDPSSYNTGFMAQFSSNGMNFYMGADCTGWNRQNSYTLSEFEKGFPFYFVNGGLVCHSYTSCVDDAKYLDDTGRVGVEIFAYEPGRDLGMISSGGAHFGFLMAHMTMFFGNVHSWEHWRSYDYGVYMTINGCSSWPGANATAQGAQPVL